MTFHSFAFIFVFLPVAVAGYFLLSRLADRKWAKAWLITVSLIFFAVSDVQDLPLLVGSVAFNWMMAKLLMKAGASPASRRTLLIGGISANIAFLCFFKYAAFFLHVLNLLLDSKISAPHSSFPLGISFYTIYQIMFLVDCYEGLVEGHDSLDHFVFAGFFPYVTMGPIVRWKQVVPQLNDPNGWQPNADNVAKGLYVFVIGFFKKVVLADSFFRWADAGFSYAHPLSLIGSWIGATAFAFQLYFDFSGYTDMAIGAAQMLNINLPQNFDAPFRAHSIIDYWRRWHITLSNFITTYLYTPMIRAMARVTFPKALMATFVAMVIAGFWHGANWTFIVFGALHGVALVLNQFWRKMKWGMPEPLAWVATFTFVIVALVFFRSNNVSQAIHIVGSMFTLQGGFFNYEPWMGIDRVDQVMGIGWMLFGVAILFRAPSSMELERKFRPSLANVALAVGLALVSCVYANGVVSRSFVYRDF
jgi:D-alanyl-lipoteichoic acid acyltransferase DltB (MBOAT superfamily)